MTGNRAQNNAVLTSYFIAFRIYLIPLMTAGKGSIVGDLLSKPSNSVIIFFLTQCETVKGIGSILFCF